MIRALVLVALFTTTTANAAPDVKQLAAGRATAADRMFQGTVAAIKTGRAVVESAYVWSVRQLDAEIDSGLLLKQALLDHVKRMTALDAELAKLRNAGVASSLDADAAAYFKLEAEYWVARGKR
jgi:hypothetical protein